MRTDGPAENEFNMTEGTKKDPLILFMPSGKRGRFPVGTPVLEAARKLGVYVESVCGGRATCGRCQVEVQEGNFAKHKIVSSNDHITARGPKEERYDRVRGLPEGRRLSCSAQILGDLVMPRSCARRRATGSSSGIPQCNCATSKLTSRTCTSRWAISIG